MYAGWAPRTIDDGADLASPHGLAGARRAAGGAGQAGRSGTSRRVRRFVVHSAASRAQPKGRATARKDLRNVRRSWGERDTLPAGERGSPAEAMPGTLAPSMRIMLERREPGAAAAARRRHRYRHVTARRGSVIIASPGRVSTRILRGRRARAIRCRPHGGHTRARCPCDRVVARSGQRRIPWQPAQVARLTNARGSQGLQRLAQARPCARRRSRADDPPRKEVAKLPLPYGRGKKGGGRAGRRAGRGGHGLSLVWKANLEDKPNPELLGLDRVMSIFIADLHKRNVAFRVPADPLSDKTWIATLDSVYGTGPGSEIAKQRNED